MNCFIVNFFGRPGSVPGPLPEDGGEEPDPELGVGAGAEVSLPSASSTGVGGAEEVAEAEGVVGVDDVEGLLGVVGVEGAEPELAPSQTAGPGIL